MRACRHKLRLHKHESGYHSRPCREAQEYIAPKEVQERGMRQLKTQASRSQVASLL